MVTQIEKVSEKQEKLNAVIVEFSTDRDVVNFVKRTESRIKTTQGNYGQYMAFLTPYAKDKLGLYVMSEALKVAGANVQGVQGAMLVLNGGEYAVLKEISNASCHNRSREGNER